MPRLAVHRSLLALVLTGAASAASWAQVPAFPGAEGFGARATGGRGGRVIEVTNLDDSGPGSLRDALLQTGPRIIVFRVGGEIVLNTSIRLKKEHSHVTVAGQTAPGTGITLRNKYAPGVGNRSPLILDDSDPARQVENVVIRFVRFRPGPSYDSSSNVDGITINGKNVIIDHCSFSWASDELLNAWYQASDITIQWSILSEGLAFSNHPDTLSDPSFSHSRGVLFGDHSTRISLHHNLIAHVDYRAPRIQALGDFDVVNNVLYNTLQTPSQLDNKDTGDTIRYNLVGNFYKGGPVKERKRCNPRANDKILDSGIPDGASHPDYEADFSGSAPPVVTGFVQGNIGWNRTDDGQPQDRIVDDGSKRYLVGQRYDMPPVTTMSASDAYERVLAEAGVTVPVRDAVDARVANEVRTNTGCIPDHPNDVGGWPSYGYAERPADWDTDHDGMPNDWEVSRGLDPNSAADGPQDADGDGYTNVEEYLNELAGSVPPPGGGAPPPQVGNVQRTDVKR